MISLTKIIEITDPYLELENNNRVFTTLEGENPGGSIKDHMVHGEIEDLLKKKSFNPKHGVSEVSSGSTATSLAYYCSQRGIRCVLFIPNTASWKLLAELQKQGAEVHTAETNSIYAFYDSYISQHPNLYRFNQLFDETKQRHYYDLGTQILHSLGQPVSAIIGGVGTGHSLLGTAQGLGGPLIISAEPEPLLKISGIRNIEYERYGTQDTCQPAQFDRRMVITERMLPNMQSIFTTEGPVQIPPSFQLVLQALKIYLRNQSNLRVFALGASLKRLQPAKTRTA